MSQSQPKPKVYRVRNLPIHVDRLLTRELLSQALPDLALRDIRIFSVAKVVDRWERQPTRTATVTFCRTPRVIEKKPRSLEWTVQLPGLPRPLIIDTHFLGMTPLNDVTEADHVYDCIAISGLSSHPFGSWQPHAGDKEFMWIRDELPTKLPGVRAILYGYDTTLVNSRSFQTIPDLALSFIAELKANGWTSLTAKPIMFLAHSLGGVINKP
ncbi:hypothetical protein PT974_05438 [Cladobotryum mycophilum]|uniref:DUF676 domain-containing protein n=1 Tax=Cladobotryum mycophilum TaxID=491253 RepID=A0ABR0SJK9_9HYPO